MRRVTLLMVVLGWLAVPTLAQSAAFEQSKTTGDALFADQGFEGAIAEYRRMLEAATTDRQRLSANWRLVQAAVGARDRDTGLVAADLMVALDPTLADDAKLAAARATLRALPGADENVQRNSAQRLFTRILIDIRATQLDLRSLVELTDESQRMERANAALKRLLPYLGDLSLQQATAFQLWNTAGWAIVYSGDSALAPIAAAMIETSWQTSRATESDVSLTAELLRLTTREQIDAWIDLREEARDTYSLAAAGSVDAMRQLGDMYHWGQIIPGDDRQNAAYWYSKAASTLHPEAETSSEPGVLLLMGKLINEHELLAERYGDAQSWFDRALAVYRERAKAGQADAMAELARAYRIGEGVEHDVSRAVQWYRMAESHGLSTARIDLEYIYSLYGGNVSEHELVAWYSKRAQLNDTDSMVQLGVIFDRGHVKPIDGLPPKPFLFDDRKPKNPKQSGEIFFQPLPAEAEKWYFMAAEAGSPEAMFRLGMLYAGDLSPRRSRLTQGSSKSGLSYFLPRSPLGGTPSGFRIDRARSGTQLAIEWLQVAIDAGHVDAHFEMKRLRDGSEEHDALEKALEKLRESRKK